MAYYPNNPSPGPAPEVAPVPWTPRDILWALLVTLGWVALLGVGGAIAEAVEVAIDPGLTLLIGTSVLLLPVWYFSVHKYGVSWQMLGLRSFQLWAVGAGCGLMTASLLFNLVYATFLGLFGLQIQPDIAPLFSLSGLPLMVLFTGAVVAPVVEEIFFRGFVFAGLRSAWGWKKAALASAGAFAMAHIVPTALLPIFILGLIFAYLYHVTNSVWPAILMHMLTNTVALSAAYAISQGWTP